VKYFLKRHVTSIVTVASILAVVGGTIAVRLTLLAPSTSQWDPFANLHWGWRWGGSFLGAAAILLTLSLAIALPIKVTGAVYAKYMDFMDLRHSKREIARRLRQQYGEYPEEGSNAWKKFRWYTKYYWGKFAAYCGSYRKFKAPELTWDYAFQAELAENLRFSSKRSERGVLPDDLTGEIPVVIPRELAGAGART
jgi:uncharacterized membrane protein YbhN (UPF0104 family)